MTGGRLTGPSARTTGTSSKPAADAAGFALRN